jgi:hypothetical protein
VVPFNLFYSIYQALEAGVNSLLDPGSGGTIKPIKQSFTILNITSAGTRTLPAASTVPLGTAVLVVASAACTVNSTSITDGGFALFFRGVDASAAAEWEVVDVVDVLADIVALQAGYPLKTVVTEATQTRNLTDADSGKIIVCTNGSAVTVNVPTGLSIGFNCRIIQAGAGLVTVTAVGTTVNTESAALTTDAQHGAGELVSYDTNVFNWHTFAVA